MATYQSTLRFLYGLQGKGIKFGLRNTKHLLKFLGNPHTLFPSIHIAGTNGKGSTAAFLASIFTEASYKTGLYTSPHLVRFTERIKIDGREIPESALVEYAAGLRREIEKVNATFFEATTCIALKYFADQNVALAVVETGLGGRLDATNVVNPMASVITSIAFDHMEYLGNTLQKIAREKAGIIKRGVPVVTAVSAPEALAVFQSVARKKKSRLIRTSERVALASGGGGKIHLTGRRLRVTNFIPGLTGDHQLVNARTACATLDVLLDEKTFSDRFSRVTNVTIRRGLEQVVRNTHLRGRFEEIRFCGKRLFLDVAHNAEGIAILAHALEQRGVAKPIVVFGVMADKDFIEMIRILRRVSEAVVAVRAKTSRALDSRNLLRHLRSAGISALQGASVSNGVQLALRLAKAQRAVVVTGSHYVVGEALVSLEIGKKE